MATYYALTTTNPSGGWRVVAIGETARDCEERAESELGTLGDAVKNHDLYAETEIKNLIILSETKAKRRGPLTRAAIDEFLSVSD